MQDETVRKKNQMESVMLGAAGLTWLRLQRSTQNVVAPPRCGSLQVLTSLPPASLSGLSRF